jgi:hypothetical protein
MGASKGAAAVSEDPPQADTGRYRRVTGALDGDPVGHRVAEGHADFHHVGRTGNGFQRRDEAVLVRIPGGDVRHQRRAARRGRPANRRSDALAWRH